MIPERCTAKDPAQGRRCAGPRGHDGDHGVVVRWHESRMADRDVIRAEPGREFNVVINGLDFDAVLTEVNIEHSSAMWPPGSDDVTLHMRRTS